MLNSFNTQTANSATTPRSRLALGGDRALNRNHIFVALAFLLVISSVSWVHIASLAGFIYFYLIWMGFVALFHRDQLSRFFTAFLANSFLIAIFYIFQINAYPDSYGTTSPLSSSWTDDSFFFSLIADSVPADLVTRTYYYLYSDGYSTVLRLLTPFPVRHPMDVIFFQSGIAALLTTFTRQFMLQLNASARSANAAYILTIICPFLLMNGGALLLRDTFSAALLIYSLSCISDRKWPLGIAAIILQIVIRPGTAIILVPCYFIIFLPNWRQFRLKEIVSYVILFPAIVVIGVLAGSSIVNIPAMLGLFDHVNLDGREVISDLTADVNGNAIFLAIQNLPFALKFILNGAYMFLYPFLSWRNAFSGLALDARAILLNIVVPVEAFWLNAWFFAGTVASSRHLARKNNLVAAVLVSLLILGTYSLQTRHKTIVYPLYYILVATGLCEGTRTGKRWGYVLSGTLLAGELFAALR